MSSSTWMRFLRVSMMRTRQQSTMMAEMFDGLFFFSYCVRSRTRFSNFRCGKSKRAPLAAGPLMDEASLVFHDAPCLKNMAASRTMDEELQKFGLRVGWPIRSMVVVVVDLRDLIGRVRPDARRTRPRFEPKRRLDRKRKRNVR